MLRHSRPLYTGRISFTDFAAVVKLDSYDLALRTAFGTSHSATTQRSNMLVTFLVEGEVPGYGEIGLPPKKKNIYFADIPEIVSEIRAFLEELPTGLCSGGGHLALLRAVEERLALCKKKSVRPAMSGLECAILDSLGKVRGVPVSVFSAYTISNLLMLASPQVQSLLIDLFGLTRAEDVGCPAYYTISMGEDIPSSMRRAMSLTSNYKVKLGADLVESESTLNEIRDILCHTCLTRTSVCVDFNCALTPERTRSCLAMLRKFEGWIKYVEQPFSLFNPHLENDGECAREIEVWNAFRCECNKIGMLVVADESFAAPGDPESIVAGKCADVLSLKLEKVGGLSAALRAIKQIGDARKFWLGCMVSSTLGMAASACLLPYAIAGDLDGALLIEPASDRFKGGVNWCLTPDSPAFGTAKPPRGPGLGVVLKK